MTPAARAWREKRISLWSARAAELRTAGEAKRVHGLESVVRRLRAELATADAEDLLDRAPVVRPPMEALPPIGPASRSTSWKGGFASADMDPPLDDWLGMEIDRHEELIRRYRLHEGREFYSCHALADAAEHRLRDLRTRRDRHDIARHPAPPPVVAPFLAGPQMEMFA